MLKIGTLKLKSNLILAPMAGVSDAAYRRINREFGCELAFLEMINARSLSHKSKRTKSMLASDKTDKPLGIQLLGIEQRYILRALDVLKSYKFDILDLNAACPAKKVVRRGEGAALLKEPKKIKEILKQLVKNSAMPVTVKIRSGWDKDSVNAVEVALEAQEAGASGLFIHGRTKLQEYSGNVDYEIIRKVKKALVIPVIASGDNFSPFLIKKMFNETGCDGVAVARGALGNPWIFRETKTFLKSGKIQKRPSLRVIKEVMLKHLGLCVALDGERVGVVKFRKFFSWYTKGLRNVRHLRERSSQTKTEEEMERIIEGCGIISLV